MTTPAETTEVVEPESTEGGDTTVVVAVDGGGDTPEPETESPDTTVVVVEGADDEGAQDDATQLDHEQRITRLEEQLGQVRSEVADKPSWDAVQSMIPSHSEIVETAEVVAAAVAVDVVEDITEDGDLDGGTVRVEEPDGSVDVVSIDPGSPPAADTGQARKPGLFRW
jgi:hypothetical protein